MPEIWSGFNFKHSSQRRLDEIPQCTLNAKNYNWWTWFDLLKVFWVEWFKYVSALIELHAAVSQGD